MASDFSLKLVVDIAVRAAVAHWLINLEGVLHRCRGSSLKGIPYKEAPGVADDVDGVVHQRAGVIDAGFGGVGDVAARHPQHMDIPPRLLF